MYIYIYIKTNRHMARPLWDPLGPYAWAGPLWAWPLWASLGPYGPGLHGPCPHRPPWTLLGQALMVLALMGWALMGLPRIYIYTYIYIYMSVYIYTLYIRVCVKGVCHWQVSLADERNRYRNMFIYMYIYIYTYASFPFVLLKGIAHRRSPVVHALPSEARHTRSEATSFVTAICTYHRLKPAHSTDYSPHMTQAKSRT